MASVSREDLILYCREDEANGDLLESLAETAEEYLANGSGISRRSNNAARYDLAVKAMTLHYLDNGLEAPIPGGIREIINQLKNSKPIKG